MFRPLSIVIAAAMLFAFADEANAQLRNPAYYGSRPGLSARAYSGEYQANRRRNVPTFTLPVYGGGYHQSYYRGGYYGRGYYPAYQQPVIIYPPVVRFGF